KHRGVHTPDAKGEDHDDQQQFGGPGVGGVAQRLKHFVPMEFAKNIGVGAPRRTDEDLRLLVSGVGGSKLFLASGVYGRRGCYKLKSIILSKPDFTKIILYDFKPSLLPQQPLGGIL